ncbi:hypothetical protein B0J11DRAFT_337131 [Dendryphion nanum]|uniref:SRR1-like domain-containing protein n=1 Tax=Dendryphion nanum TaxID=256645 RepID=A0A9P9DN07_9PLEO|nr:hypothetical protein B0J11DRAFT_337131 [Dendryphion nanum]
MTAFLTDPSIPPPIFFTKPRILHLQAEIERLRLTNGGTYTNYDITGVVEEQNAQFFDYKDSNSLSIYYHPYARMPKRELRQKAESMKESGKYTFFPLDICSRGLPKHDCLDSGKRPKETEDQFQAWEHEWQNGDPKKRIEDFVSANLDRMPRVDRIVCFALGPLTNDRLATSGCCYFQHLAACTIRDVIQSHRGHNKSNQNHPRSEKIPVFAQDPIYCAHCIATLKTRLDIDVVDDPAGFLLVDEHTFVLTIAANVAVRQIVVDVAWEEGGPAAMLCDDVEAVPLYLEKNWRLTEPWSPRLSEFVERCVGLGLGDEDEGDEGAEDRWDGAFERTSVYLRVGDGGEGGEGG